MSSPRLRSFPASSNAKCSRPPRWCRPATRRARETSGDPMTPHAILLRPPRELDPGALMRAAGVSGPPALLQRGDEDFIDATLEGLRNQTSRADLATTLAGTRV